MSQSSRSELSTKFGTLSSSICNDAVKGHTVRRKARDGYSTWRGWG
jgi:hypothetical protein